MSENCSKNTTCQSVRYLYTTNMMKKFWFTYRNEINIMIEADDEPEARQRLQEKIDAAIQLGVLIPSGQYYYDLVSAY